MSLVAEQIIKRENLGHTQFLLHSNGIIEAVCADDFTYEVEHLEQNLVCILDWTKDEPKLVLNTVAPHTNITAEARKFMSNSLNTNYVIAEAFIIHSLAQRLLASFFIKIDKPKLPTKFFNKREEAIEWLLSFK